ncbi:MAG TPA: hypothetical protein VGF97_07970 [Rhizomicrobium sp.]
MRTAAALKRESRPTGPGPLDPLAYELAARHPQPRAAIRAAWDRLLDTPRFPLDAGSIGEIPFIASHALIDLIDRKATGLVDMLGPRLGRRDDPAWPRAMAADVLSADLAIVHAPETERGWDLRWVELQTFTSLVSTIYTLHLAAGEIWPELNDLAFWSGAPRGAGWREAARSWMAPQPGSLLLENDPWSQPTRPDFEAARRWFDLEVTDPKSLRLQSGRLEHCDRNGKWRPVPHIANRLILHEAPGRAELEHLLSSAEIGWHSHPAWYYRLDKGVMPDLPLPPIERCARGPNWRDLLLPPEALVAKRCHSHSGAGVRLAMNAASLDALEEPQDWIVQPRFDPMPVCRARDGAELYAEIRCVIALPANGDPPWLACRLARMSRTPMLSTARWSGAPGEGAVPVYAPPE